jgi:ABC-type glycerol-3-phosphate transport system substrate-binding protein
MRKHCLPSGLIMVLLLAYSLPAVAASPGMTLSVALDHTVREAYEAVVEAYQKVNPNVTLELDFAPNTQQELIEKMLVRFAAGDPYDLVVDDLFEYWISPSMETEGFFVDLEPFLRAEPRLEQQFVPGIFAVPRNPVNGKLYMFPAEIVASWGVVYNQQLLDEGGMAAPRDGWTKDEFVRMARTLTKRDSEGRIQVMGFTQALWSWFRWIQLSMGGRWYDSNTLEWFPEQQQAVSAMRLFVDLFNVYAVGEPGGWARIARGQAAMTMQGPQVYSLAARSGFNVDLKKVGFVHAPVWDPSIKPTVPFSVGGLRIGDSKNQGRIQAAWEFIKYRSAPDTQLLFVANSPSRLPSRRDAIGRLGSTDFLGRDAVVYASRLMGNADLYRSPPLFWVEFFPDYLQLSQRALDQEISPEEAVLQIKSGIRSLYDSTEWLRKL